MAHCDVVGEIKPLWHPRDRGILFDRNSLIKSPYSGIRCRLDLCYFPVLYLFSSWNRNSNIRKKKICRNCAKTLIETKSPDFLDAFLLILKKKVFSIIFVYFLQKIYKVDRFLKCFFTAVFFFSREKYLYSVAAYFPNKAFRTPVFFFFAR